MDGMNRTLAGIALRYFKSRPAYTDRPMITPDFDSFNSLTTRGNLIPLYRRIFSDQLTPVLAYRRLVSSDERDAPSFLLESVEGGDQLGRYSFIGAHPIVEVIARQHCVTIFDHRTGSESVQQEDDPLQVPRRLSAAWKSVNSIPGLPPVFSGGWVGYAGYDTVRYAEPERLSFDAAPQDGRSLPDMHFGLYRQCVVFDHVGKMVFLVQWILIDEHATNEAAYAHGTQELELLVKRIQKHSVPLPAGSIELSLRGTSGTPMQSNVTQDAFECSVQAAKAYIQEGDIFQVVLSQRFERHTTADPFEIYRALRIVNPSPYMIYLQARGSILVASSPEILCRVHDGVVTNRPLAGTRKRGASVEEDNALEQELLADEKERAEHIMLVDLGRNDVGKVCARSTVSVDRMMKIERYSHVMHISSTVTGDLSPEKNAWDALRAALPVGTVSGAPKVRAMQIIDELETTRRGPYGGGIGVIGFTGDLDIALALRTMVIPTAGVKSESRQSTHRDADDQAHDVWQVHLQAGAGIVADSVPHLEYEETVNKAAALERAITLAEQGFAEAE